MVSVLAVELFLFWIWASSSCNPLYFRLSDDTIGDHSRQNTAQKEMRQVNEIQPKSLPHPISCSFTGSQVITGGQHCCKHGQCQQAALWVGVLVLVLCQVEPLLCFTFLTKNFKVLFGSYIQFLAITSHTSVGRWPCFPIARATSLRQPCSLTSCTWQGKIKTDLFNWSFDIMQKN